VTVTPPAQTGECPPLPEAIDSFREALIAKSPRTAINYVSALARFREFLPTTGCDPDAVRTDELPDDVLERFYAWLLRTRGRDRRTTAVAYTTAVRAFFRYLDRRRWLNPEQSYERIKDGLRELVGRLHYKTPRIDDAIAGVVTYVDALPVPSPTRRNGRSAASRVAAGQGDPEDALRDGAAAAGALAPQPERRAGRPFERGARHGQG
jgi:Phage integrase, N-terminal SAM-like domain